MKPPVTFLLAFGVMTLAGCSSVYYGTMERFGIEKREILVDRVEEARDSQEEAKEQFASALEQFTVLLNFQGGELQEVYDRLNSEFEDSEARAAEVSDRIRAVERVSEDLFDEWEDELELYTDQNLRASSERTLRDTRVRYLQLIDTMHAAESTMTPVLNAFRDQVLFLRHNLNSQAIASLRSEVVTIESDIATLIEEMEASIAESNRFLEEMQLI
jgi:hypothetical protein